MIYKNEEERLHKRARDFFEEPHIDEKLEHHPGHRAIRLLRDLLESPLEDLWMMGLYLLSMMPDQDPRRLADDEMTAAHIAHYLLGEMSLEEARQYVDEEGHQNPLLKQPFEELAAKLPSPVAPSVAATVGSITLIVHGTWAASKSWWRKGSDFWNHIDHITGDVYAGNDPFSWSGANRHRDRIEAGQELVDWVSAHQVSELKIIAHSHGCNVCFHATRLGLKIKELITLAVPVRLEYPPDLRNIKILHNVYSTRDFVQTPATIPNRRGEGRSLGDTESVINHRVDDDGHGGQPGHSELHDPRTWTAGGLDSLL